MAGQVTLSIDGTEVRAPKGSTILEAAEASGIYIPRLCWAKGLTPAGKCRLCTVLVNGRPVAACTQPAMEGMVVRNDTPDLARWRKNILEMLLVEGNHFCMVCEKSGACQLQAQAYRFGITAPHYPYLFPKRDVDASHPDVLIDRNRCIQCSLCVRASREQDGKSVFEFVNRGYEVRIAVNGERLADTELTAADKAAQICPVGALLVKRVGYAVPVGWRPYDQAPIGSEVERRPEKAP